MNAKSKKSTKMLSKGQKIAIGVGVGALAAGLIAGGIYLAINGGFGNNKTTSEAETTITADAQSSGSSSLKDGKNKITSGGTYTFTGSTSNGKIVVDTTETVKIILNSVSITNSEGAAIKCQEGSNVTIELVGENTLTSTDQGDSTDGPAGVISSDGDLTLTGSGSATLTGNGDGIHADGKLTIESGTLSITGSEGLEATYIVINGGDITINASDDGINASSKSEAYSVSLEINGGNITIKMAQGDTDALDSNGTLYINGGTVNITAQSPFDYDGVGQLNGGTVIVNGQTVTSLTNQMMGGDMGGAMMPGMQSGQAPSDAAQSGQTPPEMQQNQNTQSTQSTQTQRTQRGAMMR